MGNSHWCEICKVDVHRASMQKHLRSKKHLDNEKQNEIIIPERLFTEEQAPIIKKIKKVYKHKFLKQIARGLMKLNDKELEEELAKKMTFSISFLIKN